MHALSAERGAQSQRIGLSDMKNEGVDKRQSQEAAAINTLYPSKSVSSAKIVVIFFQ